MREMTLFSEKSLTYKDVTLATGAVSPLQLAISRHIDRILEKSSEIYSSNGGSIGSSIANAKNLENMIFFLGEFLKPYIHELERKDILDARMQEFKKLLRTDSLRKGDLESYLNILRELFGEMISNLGYVGLLPPIAKVVESGDD